MHYRVILSSEAQNDFQEVKRYIARDSLMAAERFAGLLTSKIKMLGRHPEMGRVVPEIGNVRIREMIIKNYRVIYEVDFLHKQVVIHHYWHAARGTPKIRGCS